MYSGDLYPQIAAPSNVGQVNMMHIEMLLRDTFEDTPEGVCGHLGRVVQIG